ncbi:MAG TPA: D-alanyl-D-alanine carboxypeptidase, partial [Acidimicrobiales bacterium]|nr:D-alanyl-D-alanine carboxypeptidase [Acidimicrobiales bacterium]
MRALIAALVIAGLAAGAGWMGVRADEAEPTAPEVATARVETPVLSVRRAPEALVAPRRRALVAAAAAPYVAELPPTACLVVSDGRTRIVDHQPALPLAPASTEKLLTAAALLEVVGPDSTFRTVLGADTAPVDGRVEGDLWLIGGGDPLLTTAAYRAIFADPAQPATELERLADAVVAAGVSEVTGAASPSALLASIRRRCLAL